MIIKPMTGWVVVRPVWWHSRTGATHFSVTDSYVFSTRFQAIQYACWIEMEVEGGHPNSSTPWQYAGDGKVRRAWKRLYRRGYRAVRVGVTLEAQDQLRSED